MLLNRALAYFFRCNRIHVLLLQLGVLIFNCHAFAQSELVLKGTPLTFYDYNKSSFVLIDDSQSFQVYNFELGKFERFDLKFAADTSFQFIRNYFVPISTPDDGTYFVHAGCGVVYHFAGDSLYRHDASFYHRNQFNAYFFEHDNQIFMLGGYGMFTEKNILVQYNKLSRDWLLVPYQNAAPNGFLSPIVHKIDNMLYLLVQMMVNQLENHLKAIPKLPDYFIGLWASDKDLSCCDLMGCLEFTVNNGVMSISGMEWSSRFLEITNNQNYFIIDILGFSEGDCFHMTLVLLYENNMLFFKEYWNNSYEQNLPTKKELQPLYKCK